MKGEIRRQYHGLISEVGGFGLCNYCKFALWEGFSCCEPDLNCMHPLAVISDDDHPWETWSGGDCWAFKPNKSFRDIAAEVGIYLEGNIPHWNKRGELRAIIPNQNDKVMMGSVKL